MTTTGHTTAARATRRVGIVQSSYIPWKGYFDLIAACDEFVLFDDVQYTKRDWRNRNRIKTAAGVQWLTIPVQVSGKYTQRIREVAIEDSRWQDAHWRTVALHYAAAATFAEYRDALEELYRTATSRWLSEINHHLLSGICRLLGITTRLRWSSEFALADERTERLASICEQAGAAEYLSGPSARAYLDEAVFARAGITVTYADYTGYPEYRQLHPPFVHEVSIIDLLLNEGAAAPRFMKLSA